MCGYLLVMNGIVEGWVGFGAKRVAVDIRGREDAGVRTMSGSESGAEGGKSFGLTRQKKYSKCGAVERQAGAGVRTATCSGMGWRGQCGCERAEKREG